MATTVTLVTLTRSGFVDVLAAADAVAASPMRMQPTWMTVAGMASMFDDGQLDDPGLRKVLPADYLRYLRGGAQQARNDSERTSCSVRTPPWALQAGAIRRV